MYKLLQMPVDLNYNIKIRIDQKKKKMCRFKSFYILYLLL